MARQIGARYGLAALLLGSGLACLLVVGRHDASAGPTPADPRDWASKDFRNGSRTEIARSFARVLVTCGADAPETPEFASGVLLQAANDPTIDMRTATLMACALGAPSTATCDELRICAGLDAPALPSGAPACSGPLLRFPSVDGTSSTAVSCSAFGADCYDGPSLGGICGEGVCAVDETYRCDGNALLTCVHGVRVRVACGRGQTCGRTAGSGILDCIGSGPKCTEDRCDGDAAVHCQKDAFGKGTERRVDCKGLGLGCAVSPLGGVPVARCAPPAGGCDPAAAPTCEAGKIRFCLAGAFETVACPDVGLAGTCSVAGSGVACK